MLTDEDRRRIRESEHNGRMAKVDAVLAEVRAEVERAVRKFSPFNSPHEGYAVIQEEVDELWDDVKGNRGRELCALEEAVQVAAMGVLYVADLRTPHRREISARHANCGLARVAT